MEAVVAVARLGGFRAAARDLGVSPTAVSNAVAGLEERIGTRLFNRTTRSVTPSDAGSRFIATIAPALAEIQGAMATPEASDAEPRGTLRINCAVAVADHIVLRHLLDFRARHPAVTVDLITEDHLIDIVAHGCDAGIRTRDAVPRDMMSIPFGPDLRFVVAASPDYLRANGTPTVPGELMDHQCIRARWPSGPMYRWEFRGEGKPLTIDVPGTLILDDPRLMRQAALAGAGFAYLWEAHVGDDLAAGRLVAVLDTWVPTSPGLALYHPGRRHVPPALRAFTAALVGAEGRRPRPISGIPSATGMCFRLRISGSVDFSEFWLSEEQFERLRPLLPNEVRSQIVRPALTDKAPSA
ncbi:LysR family transcriptional regulator [Bradyrhizobium sp. STM 3561]